jgi:hypothetical protein
VIDITSLQIHFWPIQHKFNHSRVLITYPDNPAKALGLNAIYIYGFHLCDFHLFGLGDVGRGRVMEGMITLCYIDPINLSST